MIAFLAIVIALVLGLAVHSVQQRHARKHRHVGHF